MERMLVVVFDGEAKAHEGTRILQGLDEAGVVAVYAARIVAKAQDGTTIVMKAHDVLPEATMGVTALGSLIGLLGGPIGVAVGAASGFALGAAADFGRTRIDSDFVADV